MSEIVLILSVVLLLMCAGRLGDMKSQNLRYTPVRWLLCMVGHVLLATAMTMNIADYYGVHGVYIEWSIVMTITGIALILGITFEDPRMIAGLLKLAYGIWAWFGKILSCTGDWLRKDHNWWQIGCGVISMAFGWYAINAMLNELEYKTSITTYQNAAKSTDAELVRLRAEVLNYQQTLAKIKDANNANAQLYAENQRQNADAMAKLRAQQIEADKGQVNQLRVIQNQDAVCKAALESLDVYCKSVGEL